MAQMDKGSHLAELKNHHHIPKYAKARDGHGESPHLMVP
jgi:hypothetical protein